MKTNKKMSVLKTDYENISKDMDNKYLDIINGSEIWYNYSRKFNGHTNVK